MAAPVVTAQQQKIRRIVLTGAVASITAVGAWYGAGLKVQNERHQIVQKQAELTPADKIKLLEEQRTSLVVKRMGIEKKIRQVEMREAGATREESMAGMERKRGE